MKDVLMQVMSVKDVLVEVMSERRVDAGHECERCAHRGDEQGLF